MLTITLEDYLPSAALDEELAALGYSAIQGWPDQAPVDASLARAMLRPSGMTATTLALHRGDDGRILGGAAVRWPATLDSTGRLWGPIVHPRARHHGLGRSLLHTVNDLLNAHPGVLVSTTPIPESRTEGWSLFVEGGWESAGTSELFQRPIDPLETRPRRGEVPVRPAVAGEYLGAALAELFAACRPALGPTTARDTYERWKNDSRYVADALLLVEGDDRLIGALILYPSRSDRPDEPAEALLHDILVAPDLESERAAAVRIGLVEAALRAGADAGMRVARSIVDNPAMAATLTEAGFGVVDRIRRFTFRGAR